MTGKHSRTKGRAFEQLVARELRKRWPEVARSRQSWRGAQDGPDVANAGPWWVECKHAHRADIRGAIRQAVEGLATPAGIPYRRPVAVTRDTGGEVLVTVRWADWLRTVDVELGARALVRALDLLSPAWREETLGQGEAGDEVNEAWDALVSALEPEEVP